MDDARLAEWMKGYIRAWNSNDPDHIGSLFADDSRYYTAPFRPPWMGREGIVQGWLESKDEPGQTDFTWEPLVVTDELAVGVGVTTYHATANEPETRYSNLWVLRFDGEGRCSEFTEWWMQHP
ncbi:hypothetical protein BH20ACT24_BH20ACT24_16790 [soil metagenome]